MLSCAVLADHEVSVLSGSKPPFVAGTAFDLAGVGYCEAEYAISGEARAFTRSEGGDVRVTNTARYRTRFLVYRPVDSAAFNGTVWVEWFNVSSGIDAGPAWIFAHRELVRSGAVWVGVSAQRVGVTGGESLLGISRSGLVGIDPERYSGLSHPGDRFSFDIFTSVSEAVRRGQGTILEDLDVERVVATGESQSASRLTTYVNDIDPIARAHDGFLIHARGRSAPGLGQEALVRSADGQPVLFRDDIRVPVLCLESETDLIALGFLDARQEDSEALVTWEMAGTSHADIYTFVTGRSDTGSLLIEDLAQMWRPRSEFFGMSVDKPVNTGPQHYFCDAAVGRLEEWIRAGTRPASSERLVVRDSSFVLDELGNVRGGVRSPHVDVPTSTLSGLGNSGHPIAFTCGSTTPLSPRRLKAIYGSQEEYLARVAHSAGETAETGFFLGSDVEEVVAIAALNSPLGGAGQTV